jgi:hypothetical protein
MRMVASASRVAPTNLYVVYTSYTCVVYFAKPEFQPHCGTRTMRDRQLTARGRSEGAQNGSVTKRQTNL